MSLKVLFTQNGSCKNVFNGDVSSGDERDKVSFTILVFVSLQSFFCKYINTLDQSIVLTVGFLVI